MRGRRGIASYEYSALSSEAMLKSQDMLLLRQGSVSLSVAHIPTRDHGASLV